MKTLSKNDLIKYLGLVKDLETSIYLQNEVIEKETTAMSRIVQPTKMEVPKPTFCEKAIPVQPKKPVKKSKQPFSRNNLIVLCISAIGGFFYLSWAAILPLGIMWALTLIITGCVLYIPRKVTPEQIDEYNRQMAAWESEKIRIETNNKVGKEKLEQQLKDYYKDLDSAEKKYLSDKETTTSIIANTKEEIDVLRDTLRRTMNTLDEMYSYDIIYPKYRNLIAVCTILEYLESGRIDTLEGRDGAYNLYESELRLDRIVVKLDEVIDQLYNIKDNQFLLYDEITKANKNINSILKDTSIIRNNTGKIVESQQFIAYQTNLLSKNTEAIKSLELLKTIGE